MVVSPIHLPAGNGLGVVEPILDPRGMQGPPEKLALHKLGLGKLSKALMRSTDTS